MPELPKTSIRDSLALMEFHTKRGTTPTTVNPWIYSCSECGKTEKYEISDLLPIPPQTKIQRLSNLQRTFKGLLILVKCKNCRHGTICLLVYCRNCGPGIVLLYAFSLVGFEHSGICNVCSSPMSADRYGIHRPPDRPYRYSPPPTPQQIPKKVNCHKCGKEHRSERSVCIRCGASL